MSHRWDKNLSMKNEFQDFYSSELSVVDWTFKESDDIIV